MHSYLRAIGFSNLEKRKEVDQIVKDICENSDKKQVVEEDEGAFIEMSKDFGQDIGITVCGELDEQGFHQEYYFPYFKGTGITSDEDLVIEKHVGKESYAGVCEDVRVGVSLIFYLQNAADYKMQANLNKLSGQNISTTFSGLSTKGKILLPIQKSEQQIDTDKEATKNRNHLIAAARNGDEDAIESLTLEDIDTYTMISRRIMQEDVFTIVDTFFMPYGMECDQYHIMGEIKTCNKVINTLSQEEIYQMKILCNEMVFDICINEKDLMGVPEEGRRFKGVIWLQGCLNFPE